MTKAKRYEGERQRGDIWHSNMRTAVWAAIHAHKDELKGVFKNYHSCGYVLIFDYRFNYEDVTYDVVTKVVEGTDSGNIQRWTASEPIMVHAEDYVMFPSDHLKTKLLLIAG